MKGLNYSTFKAGSYLSDKINQVANNVLLPDTETDCLHLVNDCATSTCINIQGFADCEFDLSREVDNRIHSTFILQASGDSMIEAGIRNGDFLLVDSSLQAVNNSIVVAEINSCLAIKRIKFLGKSFVLFSDNEKYAPVTINKNDNFMIWGVVLCTIKTM